MVSERILNGHLIHLRDICVEDCTEKYTEWLNDKQVNKYLESRFQNHTVTSVKEFVKQIRESSHSYLFAIVLNSNNKHIGNIKIGPIDTHNKHAFIGYIIGNRKYWGLGIGAQAIELATLFCFDALVLNKVSAGVISSNIASCRALEKVGYRQEGNFAKEALVEGHFLNIYRYGILKDEIMTSNSFTE